MASWEALPETATDQAAGLHWWICMCGRPVELHPFVNTDGNRSLYCALREDHRFESETRAVFFEAAHGVRVRPGYLPEPKLG